MESRGVTKRPRQAADEAVEPLAAWRRMVLKILMVMVNVTEMTMRLLMPSRRTDRSHFRLGLQRPTQPGRLRMWRALAAFT